jgi:hypothetical protein
VTVASIEMSGRILVIGIVVTIFIVGGTVSLWLFLPWISYAFHGGNDWK